MEFPRKILWSVVIVGAFLLIKNIFSSPGYVEKPIFKSENQVTESSSSSLPQTPCEKINGNTFLSVSTELDAGLGPDGPVFGRWEVTFGDGRVGWRHSDVGESGTYTCRGNIIIAKFQVSGVINARYDNVKDIIIWEEENYAKMEESDRSSVVCQTPKYVSPYCPKVITRARNLKTGEIRDFSDGCLPQCWVEIQ